MIRPSLKKTPYELLKRRKPSIVHFRTFGCKCFVHNNGKDNLGKFDPRSDEGVFLGYSSKSKAYRVYNKRTMCVEESIHVIFDESDAFDKVVQVLDDFDIGLLRSSTLGLEPNIDEEDNFGVKAANHQGVGDTNTTVKEVETKKKNFMNVSIFLRMKLKKHLMSL
ncbi:uncharacterized protein LOC133310512 [Gastrolobium bilobum]|uniref:uncharacterized protein LOC133310512 n=1 Tax=Gastrolobium bilobum TaxID=150636 RepID=UPI002AAF2460|nr:uncharacterized protein LOC133310512 [Gastrolobium bilobum]